MVALVSIQSDVKFKMYIALRLVENERDIIFSLKTINKRLSICLGII